MQKNIKFLKGPTANFKPQFDGNFVESQAKERSLKKSKKFQVSIKEKKNSRF